ncbi:MAG: Hdr-like menaquinol oxidoreductase cytochrome c subunit [Pseudomonadota bacterium]
MKVRAFEQSLLLVFAMALLAVAGLASADDKVNWRSGTSLAATEAKSCVREAPIMRRYHMELIKHARIDTVRKGVRGVDGSLSECIACHVNKDDKGAFIPVNQEGQFCQECHHYVGVALDCYQCHATVPTH